MPLPQSFIDNQNANSGGIAPVASDADTAYAAAQYVDQNHPNSEGPQLKPKQFGSNCVPTPSGFKVLGDPVYSALGFVYKLVWNDIPDGYSTHVREYRVYAQSPFDNNPAPTSVGSSSGSPCTVRVVSSGAGIITFWLQPVLGNGMFLPLENCPTCTSTAPNPYYLFDFGTFDGTPASVLISNDVVFSGLTGNTGVEAYFDSAGKSGVHATLVPGGFELDNEGSGGIGYLRMLANNSEIAGYATSASVGIAYQLEVDPTAVLGSYYGLLTLAKSDGTGAASFVQLSAKDVSLQLNDGTTHATKYTTIPVAAPGGGIVGGLKIIIDGTDYTLALY